MSLQFVIPCLQALKVIARRGQRNVRRFAKKLDVGVGPGSEAGNLHAIAPD